MRGLIYRELYLARKNYIFGMVSYLMFLLFGVLVRISMLHGNLAKLSEDTYNSVDKSTYYIFTFLPALLLFFALMGEGGVIVSDYKSKWNLYSYTLPVSEKKQAAVKYCIKAAAMFISLLLSIINAAVIGALCGKGLDIRMIKYILVIMFVVTVISCAATPMYVKYRSSNAVTLRIIGVCIALYAIVIVSIIKYMQSFMNNHSDMDPDAVMELFVHDFFESACKFKDMFVAVIPVIIVAAFALGFYFTVRLLKRREK